MLPLDVPAEAQFPGLQDLRWAKVLLRSPPRHSPPCFRFRFLG